MSLPSSGLGLDADGTFTSVQDHFTTSFQGCFLCFLDTPCPLINSTSEADDSTVTDVLSDASFLLAGCAGILRWSGWSPNLASASLVPLLTSDMFFFFDVAAVLFFAASFPHSKTSRGFICTTCFTLCFGLAVFMSLWSAEGRSSSALA